MIRSWLRGVVFPLTLLAFVSIGVRYVDRVFTTSTRWVFLALLLASLLPRGDIISAFRTRFAPFMIGYFLWCFATAAWSGVPLLSLAKSAALVVVAVGFIGAGYAWATRQHPRGAIYFLAPVTVMGLVAGLLGRGPSAIAGAGIAIYEGLAGNPNYLGLLAALSLPVPLYLAYALSRAGASRLLSGLCWLVVAAIAVILWRSDSRASILCALIIISTFAFVTSPGRRISIAVVLGAVAFAVVTLAPEVEQGVVQRVVIKNTVGDDVFLSRRTSWEDTYEGAKKGGAIGLGYGVSAGYTDFSFNLTSNTYGREKGNSQLAVWEETGLVGLALYAALLVVMFQQFLSGLGRLTDPLSRAEAALLIGSLAGLFAQSVFEAWWVSPGSMESALFWSMAGVMSGLLETRAREAVAPDDSWRPAFSPFVRAPTKAALNSSRLNFSGLLKDR